MYKETAVNNQKETVDILATYNEKRSLAEYNTYNEGKGIRQK